MIGPFQNHEKVVLDGFVPIKKQISQEKVRRNNAVLVDFRPIHVDGWFDGRFPFLEHKGEVVLSDRDFFGNIFCSLEI